MWACAPSVVSQLAPVRHAAGGVRRGRGVGGGGGAGNGAGLAWRAGCHAGGRVPLSEISARTCAAVSAVPPDRHASSRSAAAAADWAGVA